MHELARRSQILNTLRFYFDPTGWRLARWKIHMRRRGSALKVPAD